MYPFGRNVEAIGIKMSNWHIALCKKIMSSHNIENYLDVAVFAGCTDITARELMKLTGIERPATARAVLKRIRRAVDENDLSVGLAGLTAYPLGNEVMDAQSSKLRNKKISSGPTNRTASVDPDATSATHVRLTAHLNQASQPSMEGDPR